MVVSLPMPDCHACKFVSYYLGFQCGFSNVCHSACVGPTVSKLDCITNFDMLFLVMGFISLVDEIQFILISSHHICMVLPSSMVQSRTKPECAYKLSDSYSDKVVRMLHKLIIIRQPILCPNNYLKKGTKMSSLHNNNVTI